MGYPVRSRYCLVNHRTIVGPWLPYLEVQFQLDVEKSIYIYCVYKYKCTHYDHSYSWYISIFQRMGVYNQGYSHLKLFPQVAMHRW